MSILIPFAGLSSSPWKNGGGSTIEVAVEPPGAGIGAFDWRISLATIAQDGPFSFFPGVDRTLALLDGASLTLDIDGTRHTLADSEARTLSFPGEAAVSAITHDGASIDFNVMTRRAVCQHKFGRRLVDGSARFSPGGQRSVLFLAAGESLSIRSDNERIGLVRFDAVVFEPGKLWTLEGVDATVFIVDIYMRPATA